MKDTHFTHAYAKKIALGEMERIFNSVPYIREFHRGEVTNKKYYIRHVVEIILRIKLNNEVDAYSLYKLGYKDNLMSKRLATYLSEEYGHEIVCNHLFLKILLQQLVFLHQELHK